MEIAVISYREKHYKIINLARILFACLVIFEFLNFAKIITLNTQYTWLGLCVTALVSFALLEWTNARYVRLKGEPLPWFMWLVVVAALSLDASGDFFFLYARHTWWDQFVHFGVSATITYLMFISVGAFWIDHLQFALLFKKGRVRLALFLAAASTISLGTLYEIEEYLEDVMFHTNRSGGSLDTANDLTMNLLGVLFAAVLISLIYWLNRIRGKSK